MQYDIDEEGDDCRRAERARPVTNVLRSSPGGEVSRAPARKAARMLCRAMRSRRGDCGDAFRER
jgi:hypothetical protein